jgi:hypothetical protein
MAVVQISDLQTRSEVMRNKTEINSISPDETFGLVRDVIDTLNDKAKWNNFQVQLMKCRSFAPFNDTGTQTGYTYNGRFSGADSNAIPYPNMINYPQIDHFTTDIWAMYTGFPEDEDATKYALAFYYQSNRTFKGSKSTNEDVPYLNRFSRNYTDGTPYLQPARNVSGLSDNPLTYGANQFHTFKKMVGLKINGAGWAGSGNVPKGGIKPTKISDLASGSYTQCFVFSPDYSATRIDLSYSKKVASLIVNRKKIAQRSVRYYGNSNINPTLKEVLVSFKIPCEIRLVKEITPGVDHLVKTIWRGHFWARTTGNTTSDPDKEDGEMDTVLTQMGYDLV